MHVVAIKDKPLRASLDDCPVEVSAPSTPIYRNMYIINFPTKVHWRYPSFYEFIEKGLVDLHKQILEKDIRSIVIPPLGCGLGGLDKVMVLELIQKALSDLISSEERHIMLINF